MHHPPQRVRGLEPLLALQPLLMQWSASCGQPEAALGLRSFLTGPYVGQKIPHLLLFTDGTPLSDLRDVSQIRGAVLLHEYVRFRLSFRIFVGRDPAGERNVIAPALQRAGVAAAAARHLLDAGAAIVLLPVQDAGARSQLEASVRGGLPGRYATLQKPLRRRLPLHNSYDETLSRFGPDTRRNFRRFRRKAEADLQCTFVPDAVVSSEEFLALNERCAYRAPEFVARWRYASSSEDDRFLAGLRSPSGEWLSLVGGRRLGSTGMALDWQMNRQDLASSSLSTVMRSYLLEHEVERGTRMVYFEGGTPHVMQSAFLPDEVTTLTAVARWMPRRLLRVLLTRLLPVTNVLAQTLGSEDLQWHSGRGRSPAVTPPDHAELVAELSPR